MLDPLLSQYSVIMIDEAHERSLYTDLILGLLKKYFFQNPNQISLEISIYTVFYKTPTKKDIKEKKRRFQTGN